MRARGASMLRAMRRVAPLVAVWLASCDATVPTPAGTTLVVSPALAPAEPSSATEERTYRITGALVGRAALKVAVEHGTLRIVVAENERWAMSARCDAPSAHRVACIVTMTRKNGRLAYRVRIEANGSGRIDASALSSDVAIVRE